MAKRNRAGLFRPGRTDSRPEVGSVWMSTNQAHFGQRIKVTRVNTSNVRVETIGPTPGAHRKQVYVIRLDLFLARHVRL